MGLPKTMPLCRVIVLPIRCVLARVVVASRGSISRAVFVPVRVASSTAAVATAAAVSTAVRHGGCEVGTVVKEMKLRSGCLYAAASVVNAKGDLGVAGRVRWEKRKSRVWVGVCERRESATETVRRLRSCRNCCLGAR
jgi:hypothetical protein